MTIVAHGWRGPGLGLLESARLFREKLERARRVLDAWAPGYSKTLHTWSEVGGSAIGLSTGDGRVVWEYSWNGLTLVWSERWFTPSDEST